MIEKLKLESFIPESLVTHIYSKDGHLIAERFDTITWAREEFLNVTCSEFDCFVDSKLFCAFAKSLKSIEIKDKSIDLVLFNGARYELDMVREERIPTFEFPELKNKSAFDFGGVEIATSKSPMQKELHTVYVDSIGCVASDSIVAGVSKKFKSDIPFAIPEVLHSMLGGAEADWDIVDEKLFVSFGCNKLVIQLSKLADYDWWNASRQAFGNGIEYTNIIGLKSSLSRLSNFGTMVTIKDSKISVNKDHFEPFVIKGDGETFDIVNLQSISTDDQVGVALFGGNLYLKTKDAEFVCCAVDIGDEE